MIAGRSEVEPKLSKSSSTEWIQYLNGFERGFAPLWPVWVSDTLNQHSQESIHQDVLPKKWDVNTRKLIIIKAFVTLGKPKANNRENVLGSVLCAFSVLPRFHPFAQVFSETPPPSWAFLQSSQGSPYSPAASAQSYPDTCPAPFQKVQDWVIHLQVHLNPGPRTQ